VPFLVALRVEFAEGFADAHEATDLVGFQGLEFVDQFPGVFQEAGLGVFVRGEWAVVVEFLAGETTINIFYSPLAAR